MRSLPINTAVINGRSQAVQSLGKNQLASQPVTRPVMTLLLSSSSVYTEFGKKSDGPSKKKTHIILYLRVPKAKAKVHVLYVPSIFHTTVPKVIKKLT